MGIILESKGKFFLQKHPPDQWWADMWDFFYEEIKPTEKADQKIHKITEKVKDVSKVEELDHLQHHVTHHDIHVAPYLVKCKYRKKEWRKGKWYSPEEIKTLPQSSLAKKMIRTLKRTENFTS